MRIICSISVFLFLLAVAYADSITLREIQIKPDSSGCDIHLIATGSLEPRVFQMENPPRVVLDFPEVENKLPKSKMKVEDNSYISSIRSMEHTKAGLDFTRVVIEMKTSLEYKTRPVVDGLVLRVSPKAPPVKTTAVVPSSQKQPAAPLVLIGPEDLLEVQVFELPQFNVTGRVAGDGTITMPLIGSVEVRALSKKQAEDKIAKALEAKYINNANVSVHIKEYKSKQVSVLGAVKNPGAYYIMSGRTLLQILSDAGGLTGDAGGKCFIFRGDSQKLEVNLSELMTQGNPSLNIQILPGDVVNIPAISMVTVYVLGEVKSPGAIELSTSLPTTLLAAIARAGGVTEKASKGGIQIRRKDSSTGVDTILKVNLKDILSGKAQDVALLPGDVINVPESFF